MSRLFVPAPDIVHRSIDLGLKAYNVRSKMGRHWGSAGLRPQQTHLSLIP